MTGFLGKTYYCSTCDVGYQTKTSHHCENICSVCFSTSCVENNPVTCPTCNRKCRSDACFKRHQITKGKQKTSFCDQRVLCSTCNKIYKNSDFHICGQSKCQNCKQICSLTNHYCFMQKKKLSGNNNRYIYFDLEVDQSSSLHVVNYAICHYDNGQERIFQGYDTLNQVGKFLFCEEHKNFTFIAHNMQGYDGIFLLRYLLEQSVKPKVILNGSKILSMVVPGLKIRIIDSYSFLPMALSKLPKTFGIEEMKKGHFPHLFNTQ